MASYAYRFPKKAMQKNALTPQAKHHFTRFDQVSQLVGASEAVPDVGYLGRQLTLCSLPRTNPGDQLQYVRQNGPYLLGMSAGPGFKLPYGSLPRLVLVWMLRSHPDAKPSSDSRELVF